MHFHLNPHTILPLLCMTLAIVCGIFVILQNPRAKLNRLFFAICITFTAWFSFYIPFNFNYTDQILLTWFRASYCFISFIPITCFTFITTYRQIPRNEFWFKINSLLGLTLSLLSLTTDLIIKNLSYFPFYPYPHAGTLHPLLVLHCIYLAFFSIIIMIKALKDLSLPEKQRNHIKYMLSAIICLTFGAIDFIGNYTSTFYEIGYIPASGYLIITTIAIIKHQLMDIQVIIRKGLIYSTLITFITLIFLVLVITIEKFSQNFIGYHQDLLNSAILSLIIALIFIPLKNRIQLCIDKIFLKASPIEIAQQNELLRQEVIQTEKFKAVATLASGMAHEIKNPLTVIKTFSEYLPQKLDDKAFLKKFAPMISQEVNRIDNLVHELLDFAKPAVPILKPTNIHNLINSTLELLSNECIKYNIKIHRDYRLSGDVLLPLDYNQIKQSLLNIFLNAIEAMKTGGQLNVSTYARVDKKDVHIKIQDTGTGISPEDLPHVFDPFFTKKDSGTGLGLSITHEIISNHKGKIFVESALRKGTTFILELPSA